MLGIGFALMVLPFNLAAMAAIILANYALWAPSLGTIVDRSFRYTIDKTTREILFLPLPLDVKLQAKPFVDVTVDRMAKGIGSLMLLVFIKPWGLNFSWQQLSYVTLALVVVWFVMAVMAKREYVAAFRRSIQQQDVQPAEIRLDTADLNAIETLVTELSHPDPRRVIYAVDLLESLDKRHLVTPLLLHHESPASAGAGVAGGGRPAGRDRGVVLAPRRRARDEGPGTARCGSLPVRALAALNREDATEHDARPPQRPGSGRWSSRPPRALAESRLDARSHRPPKTRCASSPPIPANRRPRFRREVARALGTDRSIRDSGRCWCR